MKVGEIGNAKDLPAFWPFFIGCNGNHFHTETTNEECQTE
jgi:hypothetical protein